MNKSGFRNNRIMPALLLCACWAQPAAASIVTGVPYELLPLGDSITQGFDSNERGYRADLQTLLGTGGYQTDFVGPLQNGDMADDDHAGYSGERIDQIDTRLDTIMGDTPDNDPDIILLMIGTNDVHQNFDLFNAPSRLSTLIDHIFIREPSTHLLVSTILPLFSAVDKFGNPMTPSEWAARVDAFNSALPGVVNTHAGAGRAVSLVDLHALIGAPDLPDGVHPNDAGNLKLAQGWYTGIQSITAVPLPSGMFLLLSALSVLGSFATRHRRNSPQS